MIKIDIFFNFYHIPINAENRKWIFIHHKTKNSPIYQDTSEEPVYWVQPKVDNLWRDCLRLIIKGSSYYLTHTIMAFTEVTRLLLSLMKIRITRLFRMTPTPAMMEQQIHPLWIGCSDMELVVCETFFPVACKIIIEKIINAIMLQAYFFLLINLKTECILLIHFMV